MRLGEEGRGTGVGMASGRACVHRQSLFLETADQPGHGHEEERVCETSQGRRGEGRMETNPERAKAVVVVVHS